MSRGKARHQTSIQMELALEAGGEAAVRQRSGEAGRAAQRKERSGSHGGLMEQVVARENALVAFHRVRRNKGSPGIDGMTVEELGPYLREHWPALREALLAGTYRPSAVRRQLIPKSGGGMRQLGIPTVLDRFVQQLLLQVLQPVFDPTFSEHSHGFRPGRRAHDAVRKAQQYIQDGRRWVVDVELEKFFRAGRSRRYWPTCCWMTWIRHWSDGGICLSGTPMTAMCMCGRSGPGNGCWRHSGSSTGSSSSESTRRRARWRGYGAESFSATAFG